MFCHQTIFYIFHILYFCAEPITFYWLSPPSYFLDWHDFYPIFIRQCTSQILLRHAYSPRHLVHLSCLFQIFFSWKSLRVLRIHYFLLYCICFLRVASKQAGGDVWFIVNNIYMIWIKLFPLLKLSAMYSMYMGVCCLFNCSFSQNCISATEGNCVIQERHGYFKELLVDLIFVPLHTPKHFFVYESKTVCNSYMQQQQ